MFAHYIAHMYSYTLVYTIIYIILLKVVEVGTSAKHMWAFPAPTLNSEEYPHPLTRNNLEPNLQHTQNTHQCNINKQKFKCFYFRRFKFPKKDLKKKPQFLFSSSKHAMSKRISASTKVIGTFWLKEFTSRTNLKENIN